MFGMTVNRFQDSFLERFAVENSPIVPYLIINSVYTQQFRLPAVIRETEHLLQPISAFLFFVNKIKKILNSQHTDYNNNALCTRTIDSFPYTLHFKL